MDAASAWSRQGTNVAIAIYDAFISYEPNRSADRKAAGLIQEALKRAGLTSWTYALAQPGKDRFRSVVHGLRQSKCVVAVVSGASLQSKWRSGELFMGHSDAAIIPVLMGVQSKKLPFGIASLTPIVYRPNEVSGIVEAVRAFKATSAQRAKGRPAPLTTLDFLGGVGQWPPPDVTSAAEGREGIREALDALAQNPKLQQACANYESMAGIGAALSEIDEQLGASGRKEEWLALSVLAQPFNPTMMAHALVRAGMSDTDFEEALGETAQAAAQNVMVQPEAYAEVMAELKDHSAVLNSIGPPPPPPKPPPPSPPPPTPPPSPKPVPVAVAAAPVPPPAAPVGTPEAPPGDGGGCIIILGIIVGAVTLLVFLAQFLWNMFFSPPPPEPTRDVPPFAGPPSPAAPTAADVGSLPDPVTTPPAPPQRVLAYCDADLRCRFPAGGYSLSWVARDCYHDKAKWREIWVANAANSAFASRDPDKVYDGEAFLLPRQCDP